METRTEEGGQIDRSGLTETSFGSELWGCLDGFARFGVAVALGSLAINVALFAVPLPRFVRLLLGGSVAASACWSVAAAALAIAALLRGAFHRRVDRRAALTLAGAALFFSLLLILLRLGERV